MSETPEERAKRMARFSSKVQDEEDDGVAVRSFNEARDGEPASKTYDPRTGQVRAGNGEVGPAKTGGGASSIDDDELLAEIDAAVEAAEQAEGKTPIPPDAGGIGELVRRAQSPPAVPAPPPPEPLSARRLAAMAAAASDRPKAPDERDEPEVSTRAPPPAPAPAAQPHGEIRSKIMRMLGSRGDKAAAHAAATQDTSRVEPTPLLGFTPAPSPKSAFAPREVKGPATADEFAKLLTSPEGRVEVNLPGAVAAPPVKATEARFDVKADVAKPKFSGIPDLAPPSFSVKMDKEEREAPKIVSPTEGQFAVQKDQSSGDLAKAAYEPAPPAPPVLAPRAHRPPPTITSPMDAPIGVKHDAPERRTPPRIPTDVDMPVAVVRDRDERAAPPAIRSPAEDKYAVKVDREDRDMPRIRSPGDERPTARVDRDEKEPIRLRSPADVERFEAHVAKEQREAPRIQSPADAGGYAVRMDREEKAPARIASPADDVYAVKLDKEAKTPPRLTSPADAGGFEAHMAREGRTPPRLVSPADAAGYSVRMDKESKPMPRMTSPADATTPDVRMDRENKPMPHLTSPTDTGDFQVNAPNQGLGKVPRLRSAADAESFDVQFSSGQGKLPQLQSAADVENFEAKMARQGRRDFSVLNPGQSDFEVKLGHESAWTTSPTRDVDHNKKKQPQ